MILVRSAAKVNLVLNVVGKKEGMHLLDGIYVSCSLYSKIFIAPRADGNITVRYADRPSPVDATAQPYDTALKAATAIQRQYRTPGADILIEKGIPDGMGLGGSSAAGAGVIRGMERLFGIRVSDEVAVRIGSDIPFQRRGGCYRVGGIGERLTKVSVPPLLLALLCPPNKSNSAECFRVYDEIGGASGSTETTLAALQKKEEPRFYNGLERAATTLNKGIEEGRMCLEKAGFSCGMTGSGSALFGIEYDRKNFYRKLMKVDLPEGFRLLTASTKE